MREEWTLATKSLPAMPTETLLSAPLELAPDADRARDAQPDLLFDPTIPAGKGKRSYTWTGRSHYVFTLTAYTVSRFLERHAQDVFEVEVKGRNEFQFAVDRHAPLVTTGTIIYSIDGHLVALCLDAEDWEVTVRSKHDIQRLIVRLKSELKHGNPLRGKHLQLVPDDRSFRAVIKATPKTSFDDLILDRRLIEDIADNTIFQLKATHLNNGVIFYGEPGTGKSLACQAVIREAVAEGFTSCYVVGAVKFSELNQFLTDFLTPCVLIFEDIDSFAGDRIDGDGGCNLADFLQFLSGLTERSEQIIVIATTNYLELLDKAVRNRPVRFNRKYHFARPGDAEIDRLLDLYFGAGTLGPEQKRLCHGRDFSGAHISELKRTATTLAHKSGRTAAAVFAEAVALVTQHFAGAQSRLGFGA